MKLIACFDEFMTNTVNLNDDRILKLEERVSTVEEFVGNNYEPAVIRSRPQGSWAHKTIIKPATADHQFDADLVFILRHVPGWSARDYVDNLHAKFAGSDRYRDMVGPEPNTRCATLTYAGDFHLDVVPCLFAAVGGVTGFWICNRTTNRFEQTASEEYTNWIVGKNNMLGKNMLRKVVRLLKYLRDGRGMFTVKSILLTTLVGEQVWGLPNLGDDSFADLPTALKTLVGRLDDWLQMRPMMPPVVNPVLLTESFNRHWSQGHYYDFCVAIHRIRGWIDDAHAEPDRNRSIQKWRGIFGEKFARGEASPDVTLLSGRGLAREAQLHGAQYVASMYGLYSPPHARRPDWSPSAHQIKVDISAAEHQFRNGPLVKLMRSGDLVTNGNVLRFEAHISTGFPAGFEVHWQVTNTGNEATDLRGTYYKSSEKQIRWEDTSYPGIHWIKAYVVNSRTKEYVGKSAPFLVTIG